jgi:hypothetical protein
MSDFTCCNNASWVLERDLAHAAGFEYSLGHCSGCRAPWMNVFCVASGKTGYERVTADDVRDIRCLQDVKQLQDFMRGWGDRNL